MINHSYKIYFNIAAFFLGCFLLLACENDIKKVQDLGKKTLGIEEGINIESYMSQAGKTKARLTAPLMLRYLLDTPKVEFTKTMHVDFFDDTLGVESVLNCKYGRYIENDSKVYLRDSVIVFNRLGDTLWTNELIWDQNKAEFFTDKPVKVKKEFNKQYIFAQNGMRSNQTLTDITFFFIKNPSYLMVPEDTY